MKRFKRRRVPVASVSDAVRDVGDGLRSGLSLRQAIVRAAGKAGSPLTPAATALAAGQPLVASLRAAAAETQGGDADLSSALCVLAVHAETGGDPLPAVRSLTEALSRRKTARAEARALTTQARLGARALLLLTPAFLLLLVISDPGGVVRWMGDARTRAAIFLGLVLQVLGAFWMSAIVRSATGQSSRFSDVPVVRAFIAMVSGRARPTTGSDVAEAAETMAFALDAGLSPSAALRAVAPYAKGPFGQAVRQSVDGVGAHVGDSLRAAVESVGGESADRFVSLYLASATLGVPLAPALRSLADELRESVAVALNEEVRRASVRVLVPLGLLVLPAFVLACLVPLFVGGLQGITG